MRTFASSFLLTKPISSSAFSASTSTTGRGRESVSRSWPLHVQAGRSRKCQMWREKEILFATSASMHAWWVFAAGIWGHLGCRVGIITDVENHSLGSFVESHASLEETETHMKTDRQDAPHDHEPHCLSIIVQFVLEQLCNVQQKDCCKEWRNKVWRGACHQQKPTQGGSHAPGFRPRNTCFGLSTCHGGKKFNSRKCQVLEWLMQVKSQYWVEGGQ